MSVENRGELRQGKRLPGWTVHRRFLLRDSQDSRLLPHFSELFVERQKLRGPPSPTCGEKDYDVVPGCSFAPVL